MLKRFKLIKGCLQAMVISDKWESYREDDVVKARHVEELVLDDIWCDKINYILSFTSLIYDMLRNCDTDTPCLHLVYDMWDTMIQKMKTYINTKDFDQLNSLLSMTCCITFSLIVGTRIVLHFTV